jgi:hypothetical protein
VRRECPVIYPPIDGVASDAEMFRHLVYRVPPFVHVSFLRLKSEVDKQQT